MRKMAENSQQGFITPSSLLGSSYILNRNVLMCNILTMPLHQDKANPPSSTDINANQSSTKTVNSTGEKGPHKGKNLVHSVIRGAYYSALATVVAPLSRVQLLIQCQNELLKTGRLSTPYKGIKDCFLRTIKHEGFFSLWRGNSVALFSACAFEACVFATPNGPRRDQSNTPLAAVALASLCSIFIKYPLEYAKVRLANDVKPSSTGMRFSLDYTAKTLSNNRQFGGAFDVIRKTFISDGFAGLFRGSFCACVGIFGLFYTDRVIKLHTITYMRQNQNQNQNNSKKTLIGIGSLVTVHSRLPLIFYPIRTVSHRMMMTSGEANKYKGPLDALYQIVRKEGVSSLFKGATLHMIIPVATLSTAVALNYILPISEIVRRS